MRILSPHITSESMREFWNTTYDRMRSFEGCYSTNLRLACELSLTNSYLPSLVGKKVMKIDLWDEVHNSGFLIEIARLGADVYGFDISDHIVTSARENFRKLGLPSTLVAADMRAIPFPTDSFDLVWQIGTIEHVHDPTVVFNEVHRVLKPGGIAIMGCPNRHDPYGSQLVIYGLGKLGLWPYEEELSFSFRDLEAFMAQANFQILERTSPYLLPWFLRYTDILLHLYAKPLDLLLRPLIWPFHFLNRSVFLRRYANHVVCIGRKPARDRA